MRNRYVILIVVTLASFLLIIIGRIDFCMLMHPLVRSDEIKHVVDVLSNAKTIEIEGGLNNKRVSLNAKDISPIINVISEEISKSVVLHCKYKYAVKGKIKIVSSRPNQYVLMTILTDSVIRCIGALDGSEFVFYVRNEELNCSAEKLLEIIH